MNSTLNNNRPATLNYTLFFVVLTGLSVIFYHDFIFQYPYSSHTWAQADRLALANSYYNNGMNFFLPATYNRWAIEGIATPEFPIQSYLSAALGFIFGKQHISTVYRLLTLSICITGLWFLFLSSYKYAKSFTLSLIAPLFIFCIPLYSYYACNYLPDAAAVSICFIGFHYFLKFADTPARKSAILTIIFFSLATLIKTSTAPYWGVSLLVTFFLSYKKKKELIAILLTAIGCIVVVAGYYFYNKHLGKKYESGLFLAKPMPFESFAEVKEYLEVVVKEKMYLEYLSLPQYIVLAVLVTTTAILSFRSKMGKLLIGIAFLFLLAALVMAALVGRQLRSHDYYLLPLFFPFIAFTLLLLTRFLHQSVSRKKYVLYTLVLAQLIVAGITGYKKLQERIYPLGKGIDTIEKIKNSAAIVQKLNLPSDTTVVVLNETSPNTAFVYMDVNGYNLPNDKWGRHKGELADFMLGNNLRLVFAEDSTARMLVCDTTGENDFIIVATHGNAALIKLQ